VSRRVLVAALFFSAVAAVLPRPAAAIPVFAGRYGLTCQACHTVVPHLTAFGEQFLANGYRVPGLKPKSAFPVALRVETAYSSASGGDAAPLPKTIVDEVEMLTGGALGKRGSYWAEVYAVDGGFPGRARDVWAAWRATPDGTATPVTLRAGRFTLPLPLDPETFRETTDHYAIWDQTAGDNPFSFFDPKLGGQIVAGDPARGIAGSLSLLQGHDTASGLPAHGVDTMLALQRQLGAFVVSAYRYDGSRGDRFWRDGYGIGWETGSTRVDAVYQNGNDAGSGAFLQLRQAFGDRAFGIARWDATAGPRFARSVILGGGVRFSRNTRLTVFETAARDAAGRFGYTTTSSFLFAL
jgi:hypothetical protein